MSEVTTTRHALAAFAGSHPGLHRDNNEDRCHADADRGIFFVVDGVGGQAAGDKAAEIAQSLLRARLERETGAITERIREAITLANNEIYRVSRSEARFNGMACVLTVAVVRDGLATIGHVGDTRLYKLRAGTMRKVTLDHSPVGDREDRGELSEIEAMRHPRRNEIFRDVGSEPHNPEDDEFIDLVEIPFEADSALLLCTDGLTDMVTARDIAAIAARHAGNPALVVRELLKAANAAGGKDNVSAVFIEGDRFAAAARDTGQVGSIAGAWRSVLTSPWLTLVAGCVLGAALLLAALVWTQAVPAYVRDLLPARSWPRVFVVSQEGPADFTTIRAALDRARAGDTVRVEPGEYRERVVLTGSVTLVSARPHEAVILAPPGEKPGGGVGVEFQAGRARLSGFRITGDAGNPLAIGVRLRRSDGEVDDIEVSRAAVAGIQVEGASRPTVRGSYIHDNPGVGILIGPSASPRLLNNVIADNGRQAQPPKPGLEIHETARPFLFGNIIANNGVDVIRGLSPAQREEVARDNIVGRPVPAPAPTAKAPRKKAQ